MICAMVDLQGLHSGNAFRCHNVSASMGLKSWQSCATCQAFAGMSTQSILDNHSGCKAKHDKEYEDCEEPTKPLRKRSLGDKRKCPSCMVQILPRSHKEQNVDLHLPSSQASEHKLVHSLDHSRSSWTHFQVILCSVR